MSLKCVWLQVRINFILNSLKKIRKCVMSHNKKSRIRVGLPKWLRVKNLAVNAGATGNVGSIPGWERSPGGGNGNPL